MNIKDTIDFEKVPGCTSCGKKLHPSICNGVKPILDENKKVIGYQNYKFMVCNEIGCGEENEIKEIPEGMFKVKK